MLPTDDLHQKSRRTAISEQHVELGCPEMIAHLTLSCIHSSVCADIPLASNVGRKYHLVIISILSRSGEKGAAGPTINPFNSGNQLQDTQTPFPCRHVHDYSFYHGSQIPFTGKYWFKLGKDIDIFIHDHVPSPFIFSYSPFGFISIFTTVAYSHASPKFSNFSNILYHELLSWYSNCIALQIPSERDHGFIRVGGPPLSIWGGPHIGFQPGSWGLDHPNFAVVVDS